MGDFEISTGADGHIVKNGGNVASYLCTPDGRVIHAVLGPVPADKLLAEMEWAVTSFQEILENSDAQWRQVLTSMKALHCRKRRQIYEQFRRHRWGTRQQVLFVHDLLGDKPLPPLQDIHQRCFAALGEQTQDSSGVVTRVKGKLEEAQQRKRPVLFAVRSRQSPERREFQPSKAQTLLTTLWPQFVTVVVENRDLPALSAELGVELLASPEITRDTYLIAASDRGKQMRGIALHGGEAAIAQQLVRVLMDYVELRDVPLDEDTRHDLISVCICANSRELELRVRNYQPQLAAN